MPTKPVMLITGSRRGIGRHLVEYYLAKGFQVVGCSRKASRYEAPHYDHFIADVGDERAVGAMFSHVRKQYGTLDVLVNNAGIAAMNHSLLTPLATVQRIMSTNVAGTFLCCREAARLMRKQQSGRIVNFSTVAVPLRLAGEAIYAASKAAVVTLTEILAKEFAPFNITVNAVGPTPIKTDLIRGVPEESLDALIQRQAVQRYGEFRDVTNVVDFFISPQSDFVTGQVIYLGGVTG